MHVVEWIWLALMMVGPPLGAILTRRIVQQRTPPRHLATLNTIVNLALMGGLTFAIDHFGSRLGARGLHGLSPASLAAWTAGTLGLSIAISVAFVAWRVAGRRPVSRVSRLLLPATPGDWPLFFLMSCVAGTVEEFLCRGFEMGLVTTLAHSAWLAAGIVAVFFGLGHVAQDRVGALRAAVLGLVLAVPVIVTGSLLPSMLAHAATNLLTPAWMGRALAIPEASAAS